MKEKQLAKNLCHHESVINFRLISPTFWCVWRSLTIFCPFSYATQDLSSSLGTHPHSCLGGQDSKQCSPFS